MRRPAGLLCGHLLGRHGLWTGGLASDPINMYEEVMQAPMIWHWLGHIPAQSVRNELRLLEGE